MKIATHNVEFLFNEGEHKHSGKNWYYSKEYVESRIEHLSKLYSDIDADVLFLQEVASEDVIKRVITKTGKDYSYFIATPDKFGVGNAVLYKTKDCICESISATTDFPVLVKGDIDALGHRIHSRRAFIHLTTKYNDKPLHLLGLHLNSRFFVHLRDEKMMPVETLSQIEAGDSLIRSEAFRFIQARKMRQVIDTLFKADINTQIAVMGDFNSLERETPFRIIKGEFESHDDALVSIASRVIDEDRYSFVGENGKKLIDYILTSKNLEPKVKSFKILNEDLKNHSNKPPQPAFIESDHAPLVMGLE